MTSTENHEATGLRAPAREPRRKRARLTPEQQDLAARHVALARSLAKPLKETWPKDIEEFDSAACLALVEAAQSFEPGRGVKFATFARFRILGSLRDVQRRVITRGYERDLPNAPRTYHYVPGAQECGMLMMTSPDAPVGDELEAAEEVEKWVGSLPHRHAQACREIYLRDSSQSEVAASMGCSKSRVSYLHSESLALLRQSNKVQAAAMAIGLGVSRN